MPTRNRKIRIMGGPQGEDAFIELLIPTIGDMRQQVKTSKKYGAESDEAEENARKYLANHVINWNWVDDDDKPLESPKGNAEVFSLLTKDELTFIGKCLSGTNEETIEYQKKLQPK